MAKLNGTSALPPEAIRYYWRSIVIANHTVIAPSDDSLTPPASR